MSVEALVKSLRMALHEAWKAGDTDAVHLLTKTLAEILDAPPAQVRIH